MNFFRHLNAIFLACAICASCALCAFAPSAMAADGRDYGSTLQLAQGGCMTLDQAVEQVRRQYDGRIVSAETKVSGNRETHYIKVLTDDGKVKTVTMPGCTRANG